MRNILFITGTRADFGKIKSLISELEKNSQIETFIFATGMHLLRKYGLTVNEIQKAGFKNIYRYINQNINDSMDMVISKTIQGLSDYVKENAPDLIVVHGDRVETLAGAIVGSLNNILVAHIEGGELSGTIDELVRHSVSKLSHVHFVSNADARDRLIKMGETKSSIYIIGSPDIDVMRSKTLPSLASAKARYKIHFRRYAIVLFHPVTTEISSLKRDVKNLVDSLIETRQNYIVIFPNNDLGSADIFEEYKRLDSISRFLLYPSLRFENFLILLKNADFIIGNSSAGVREAPYYGLPSINIGTRQNRRADAPSIINIANEKADILEAIERAKTMECEPTQDFGDGNSAQRFFDILDGDDIWHISKQKDFYG